MGEPVLWGADALAGYRFRYRLLVLPSFFCSYVIAIDQRSDGRIEWRYIRRAGQCGYVDGGLGFARRERLAPDRLVRLKAALVAARFAERLPDKRGEKEFAGDPVRIEAPTMDGTQMVFEKLDRQGYHLVSRHDGGLDAPMRALIALSFAAAEIMPNSAHGDPEP